MYKINVKFMKVDRNAIVPKYGTDGSAAADLYSCSSTVRILPGETKMISTGIAMEIPKGHVGLIFARSGLACKKGIALANGVGVIDSDYRGEIKVALHNFSNKPFDIGRRDRIAQIMISPFIIGNFEEVQDLSDTGRGTGGFGSTGII